MRTEDAVKTLAGQADTKTRIKLYQEILVFPQTGDVSLFKNNRHQVSVSIWLNSSRMCPIICLLTQTWVQTSFELMFWTPVGDSIRRSNMLDIRSATDTNLKVSETITLHLRLSESRTCFSFRVLSESFVTVQVGRTYFDKLIKRIHPAERKVVTHHSMPVQIIMVRKDTKAAKNYKMEYPPRGYRRFDTAGESRWLWPVYISVSQQVVLKVIYEISVLFFTQAGGLIAVVP